MGIVNFIAYAPADNAGVITVTAYPRGNVSINPFGEKACVVVFCLVAFPHIEALRHDEETHFVGKLHKLNGWHIMGSADSVYSHNAKLFKLSAYSISVHRRSQRTKIVVLTAAVQLYVPVVEEKAAVGGKLYFSEAEATLVTVNDFSVPNKLNGTSVQMRVIDVPKDRPGYFKFKIIYRVLVFLAADRFRYCAYICGGAVVFKGSKLLLSVKYRAAQAQAVNGIFNGTNCFCRNGNISRNICGNINAVA